MSRPIKDLPQDDLTSFMFIAESERSELRKPRSVRASHEPHQIGRKTFSKVLSRPFKLRHDYSNSFSYVISWELKGDKGGNSIRV